MDNRAAFHDEGCVRIFSGIRSSINGYIVTPSFLKDLKIVYVFFSPDHFILTTTL